MDKNGEMSKKRKREKKKKKEIYNMAGELNVAVLSDVDTEVFERLEDSIRDLLEREGLKGIIEDFRTGNITKTRDEMMGKHEEYFHDQNIKGILMLGEKVWFNDDLRCRLRICGWTKEQQEKLKNAKFIDLTLTDSRDEETPGVMIHIGQFNDKDRENTL